ncbi:hypothetical protein FKM82_016211 [Ascaphus truei]
MERMERYSMSPDEESTQMWNLNKRLEAYLSRVKALEEENELLRAEIHGLKSNKSEKCWKKKYEEELNHLRDVVEGSCRERTQAEIARDLIREEIEYVKSRCLEERQAQEDAKKELSESKKVLEEERRAQIWLKENIIQLHGELEDMLKVHEEEKASMEQDIASFSQRLENIKVAPIVFQPVDMEDYAKKLSEIWHGAVETYKSEVSLLEVTLSEANENLRKVVEENKQNRLTLQNLDKELLSLKMRKEMLEEHLSNQWQDQQEEEGKVQLEIDVLDKEKQDLRAQIAQVLEDRQQLMHLKMSLSLEVATYRSLLEAESTRFYTPVTDYKMSSTLNDSRLEKSNDRKRMTADSRKLASREHRLGSSQMQNGEKNGLLRSTPKSFVNVKRSTFQKTKSPVTKEFQKVSSVLQSQGVKYTRAPYVKADKPLSMVENNLEKIPQSGEVFRKTKIETISNSFYHGSSKTIGEQTVRNDITNLSVLNQNTNPPEYKGSSKKDNLDNMESDSLGKQEVLVGQSNSDVLEFTLEKVADHDREFTLSPDLVLEGEQMSRKEGSKEHQEKHIDLHVQHAELLDEKIRNFGYSAESCENADIENMAEEKEVISDAASCQKVYFEKQDTVDSLQYKRVERTDKENAQEVTQDVDFPELSAMDKEVDLLSSSEIVETDLQQEIVSLQTTAYDKNGSEMSVTENDGVSEIISKSMRGSLGNEFQTFSEAGVELTSHQEGDSKGPLSVEGEQGVYQVSVLKQDTDQYSDDEEESLQSNQEEQNSFELSDDEQDSNKLTNAEQDSQLSEAEGKKSLNVSDTEEESPQFKDAEQASQQTSDSEGCNQPLCEAASNSHQWSNSGQYMQHIEDIEQEYIHSSETEVNTNVQNKSDKDYSSYSSGHIEISQVEHSKAISTPETLNMSEDHEENELLLVHSDKRESDPVPNEQDIDLSKSRIQEQNEDITSETGENQNSVMEGQNTNDNKEDQIDNKLDTNEVQESVSASEVALEKSILLTSDNALRGELEWQEHENVEISEEETEANENKVLEEDICRYENINVQQHGTDNVNVEETIPEREYVKENAVEQEQERIDIKDTEATSKEVVNEDLCHGSLLSDNESGKMDIMIDVLCESEMVDSGTGNEESVQELVSSSDSANDSEHNLEKENEGELIKPQHDVPLAAEPTNADPSDYECAHILEEHKEEGSCTVLQLDSEICSEISPKNLTETLYVQHPGDVAVPGEFVEEQKKSEDITVTPTVSKMENENSESEESVDSQEEISLHSQKSEEFEISKDYQLDQTLPDTTPLPDLEDEVEDLPEEQAQSIAELTDIGNDTEEYQYKEQPGETLIPLDEFPDSPKEKMDEKEFRELMTKTEEYIEEELVTVLPTDTISPIEDTTTAVLNQELCYLGDNEVSDDSKETAGILEEDQSDDHVGFAVTQNLASEMPKNEVIIQEQVEEHIGSDEDTDKAIEDSEESEKDSYQRKSDEEGLEFTDEPNKNMLTAVMHESLPDLKSHEDTNSLDLHYATDAESEAQNTFPVDNISTQGDSQVGLKQSENTVISDSEGSASSDEDSPNASNISHVSELEGSTTSTNKESDLNVKVTTSIEVHEKIALEKVVDKETLEDEKVLNIESLSVPSVSDQEIEVDDDSSDDLVNTLEPGLFQEQELIEHKSMLEFTSQNYSNKEKMNGLHEHTNGQDRLDFTKDMLNGHSNREHSEIVLSEQKSFDKLEGGVVETHTQEFPDEPILTFSTSAEENKGLFQSRLKTSESKDGSGIDEVHLLASDYKNTINIPECPESIEESESRCTKLLQNPYLKDNDFDVQTQMIATKSSLADEEMMEGNETYEEFSDIKFQRGNEDSWSSPDDD